MRGPGLPSLFILTGRSMTSTPRCWCPGARLHPAGRRAPVGGPARPRPAAGARGQVLRSSARGGGAHAEPPLETAQGPPCPPGGARSAQPTDARLPLPGHAHPAPEGVQPPRRHDQQRRHPVLHHGACPRRVAPSGARPSFGRSPARWPSPVPAALPAPQACRPLASLRRSSLPASAPPLGALSAWGIPEKPSTLTTC